MAQRCLGEASLSMICVIGSWRRSSTYRLALSLMLSSLMTIFLTGLARLLAAQACASPKLYPARKCRLR